MNAGRVLLLGSCLLVQLLCVQPAPAALCKGRMLNPFTDVCWQCLFPITIGNAHVVKGSQPDTPNPSHPLCSCPSSSIGVRIGLSLGFWEPFLLVDITRHPYCLVNLGGLQLAHHAAARGEVDSSDPSQGGSFYYAHAYAFPLLSLLNILTDGVCAEQGDLDIATLTELDPTWHDDELTFLLNPEAALFANLPAQAACAADSLAAQKGLPIDRLFWCAGSQGAMYPLNGFVQEHVGGVQASTLLAERLLYKLHREGLLWDTQGKNGPGLCSAHPAAILPKSRYRYQMVYPVATASRGENGCHPLGHSTASWEALHEIPVTGEDFGYLIWRKRNCCVF